MEALEWGTLVPPFIAAVVAFAITAAATPVVRYVARRRGFVAQPRADRWHQRPTALLGGAAIYLGIIVPLVLLSPSGSGLRLLAVAITGIFLLGFIDDVLRLRPHQKLVAQIALSSLVVAGGTVFRGVPVAVLAAPLTVFWLVAITNAFNLLDNMDGLTAGIAACTAAVLLAMGVLEGNAPLAVAAACIVGASAGFLLYNSYPASIFMGDAGSLTLGLAVGGLSVLANGYGASQNVFLTVVVPIAVLGVPLFDTTLVSVMRTLAGRPVSQGGRDHTSHRLVALGLSESQTVRVLYAITVLFGTFAVASRFMDVLTSVAVLLLLVVGLGLFGFYLAQVKVYHGSRPASENGVRSLPARGVAAAQKVPIADVLLDSLLIVLSYLFAYLLKFESNIYGTFLAQFARSVPYVLALKLAVLLLAGVYRGGWRYAGLPEVVSLGKASTLGSLASVVAVAVIWRFDEFSRSVFVIDWMLFTWLLVLSRMSFRLLGHWVQSLSGSTEGRLLVIGGGSRGAGVVRAIQHGVYGDFMPVGFVQLQGGGRERRIAGVEVLGDRSQLGELLDRHQVDAVVLVMESDADSVGDILDECSRRGLFVRKVAPLEVSREEAAPANPEGPAAQSLGT